MSEGKKFRWLSVPGLLIMLVACSIFDGGDDDDEVIPPPTFYVTAEVLNVRRSPSAKSAVVGKAIRGTKFVPSHTSGQWYGVQMSDGTTGWVHQDYVAISTQR